MCYEARARVAIWMRDRAGFERFAGYCATEYAKGQSPYLSVKYARLMDEARQRELSMGETMIPRALSLQPMHAFDTETEVLRNRILECTDGADRARCVLTVLLQSTESYLGYLYGVEESGLAPLAGLPETKASPPLEAWLASWVAFEMERADEHAMGTVTYSSEPPSIDGSTREMDSDRPGSLIFADGDGRRFFASPLATSSSGPRTLVAMLAVQITGGHLPNPPVALCSHLAQILLEHGDVKGVELGGGGED
jgi:hypothetical protein